MLSCVHCGKEINWSIYEQLLCQRGTFVKPTRCTGCAEQELALGKPQTHVETVNRFVVKMPSAGRWQSHDRIRDWPRHLTYDAIEKVEKSDARIVVFGDDLTYSADNAETAWPFLLEKALNQSLGGKGKVAVVNAGMPKCTSEQALLRFARDVAPFEPHLIIFSFAFADSLLKLDRHDERWRPNIDPDRTLGAMEALCRKLVSTPSRLIYWTTNPMFPLDYVAGDQPSLIPWAKEQTAASDHCLRQAQQVCKSHEIPILELRARFEVNGTRSAKKWMANWYNHNEVGAQNIATWFAAYILNQKLLPIS